MSTAPIHGPIQIANKLAAEWVAQNPVLLKAQLGLETDTRLLKAGDGATPWNSLAYTAGGSSVSVKTVNNTVMTGTGNVSTDVIDVPYSTAVPLDNALGKRMPRQTIASNTVWTLGTGPVPGGACEVVVIGDGTHTLTFPSDWTYVPGSSGPALTINARFLLAMFYVDNSVLVSVTPLSSIDTTAPTLISATVAEANALRINLVWSEPINAAISAETAFTISAGHTITAHTYDTSTTTHLTVTTPFITSEARTLSYTEPGSNQMQDLTGNRTVSFSGRAITNTVVNPTLVSATVGDADALRINLLWSESMNSTVSAGAAFTISAGHTVVSHVYDDATHSHLVITTPFVTSEARTLAYAVPVSDKMMDSAGGNLVAAFSGTTITNTVVNPTLVSAIVSDATPSLIDLTWSEAMYSGTIASYTAFTVSSGHALTGHAYIDATHTQLTTSTPFGAGETKTLAYSQPGANDMRDAAGGNLVASFSGAAITDNVSGSRITFTDPFTGTDGDAPNVRWTPNASGWTIQGNKLSYNGAAYDFITAACTAGDNTVSVDVDFSGLTYSYGAIFIRLVDVNNYVAVMVIGANSEILRVMEVVAGVVVNSYDDPGGATRTLLPCNLTVATVGTAITVTVTGGANPGSFGTTITNHATAVKIGLGINNGKAVDTFDNCVLS